MGKISAFMVIPDFVWVTAGGMAARRLASFGCLPNLY
jgi:hypothetical protein